MISRPALDADVTCCYIKDGAAAWGLIPEQIAERVRDRGFRLSRMAGQKKAMMELLDADILSGLESGVMAETAQARFAHSGPVSWISATIRGVDPLGRTLILQVRLPDDPDAPMSVVDISMEQN